MTEHTCVWQYMKEGESQFDLSRIHIDPYDMPLIKTAIFICECGETKQVQVK